MGRFTLEQFRAIVKSAVPPKETEVLWLDVSEKTKPFLRYYYMGKWEALSSTDIDLRDLKLQVMDIDKRVTALENITIFSISRDEINNLF